MELPLPGSLQEVVCVLVQRYRQEQEVAKLIALMSTTPEAKRTSLDAFKQAIAPHVQRSRKKEADLNKERLERYLSFGPVLIKPGEE